MRDSLEHFSEPVARWFKRALGQPTRAQELSWPLIAGGRSTLLLAPTGSGKTLAAFLAALDRMMFRRASSTRGVRVLYISPLKALGSDVEKNLQVPVAGISEQARVGGVPFHVPSVGMRTGDTPRKERARLKREPPEILITTPESLYLMLTSEAREALRSVETVIVDEIHSLVPTKRGTHLVLSLERLERLRAAPDVSAEHGPRSLQRIGLSATQTPLTEVAAFLGGAEGAGAARTPRPVSIVDAGRSKSLVLSVELPWAGRAPAPAADGSKAAPAASAWEAIHPRLVELVREHRSTMIFVNNRGLTERLAGALNDLAGEEICLAHHGSISKERRRSIEEQLKRGELRAVVATSSLELGIDVGAVDLVIQIEAPPSVSSALQRVGRSGHQVGLASKGVVFPKHKGDLLTCACSVARMHLGAVESSYYPRNPLDVLAQQIVAMCAVERFEVADLFDMVQRAAPYAELTRAAFDGVLDMLTGRYPSDEFAGLRPRLTWDRAADTLRARQGAQKVAVLSGGTIPDRGLFGVFVRAEPPLRVGELDEEMVFESRVGDVFVLGASSWRIEEITFERVYVTPAPAEPGRMPFWHGDSRGRPAEFGRAIGELTRRVASVELSEAQPLLEREHGLEPAAAVELWEYVQAQRQATVAVPSDRDIIVERFVDEVGDTRVCVLSPFGTPVHAPWAISIEMAFREALGTSVESIWLNDGIVFRVPEAERLPEPELFFPDPDLVEELLVKQLGHSALFSARFRENAARALLLPRHRPGGRTPLWAQRKRSARLLQAALKYRDFPIVLETFRECLKDAFDLGALRALLRQVSAGSVRVHTVDTKKPSPFSATLLFAYAGNFVYDRDAPLAERRAHVLTLSNSQLREVLGEAELRQLIDPACLAELAQTLAGTKHPVVKHVDGLADALVAYGDTSVAEARLRATEPAEVDNWFGELLSEGRALAVTLAGEARFIAIEDAARYRDALGLELPPWVPGALLAPAAAPLVELVARFARCHVPFAAAQVAARFGMGEDAVGLALVELERQGRVERGAFLPGGSDIEWCDVEVLRLLKRRSLSALRRQIEPVAPDRLADLMLEWQHVSAPRAGIDGLLDALEQLEAAPLNLAELESEILPARVADYAPGWLDELISAGEIVWRGLEPIGPKNGRLAFFLADDYPLLAPPSSEVPGSLAAELRQQLAAQGALFFHDLVPGPAHFRPEVLKTLWSMVWAGEVTNDTMVPLRSLGQATGEPARGRRPFRTRRAGLSGSEGRWSLLPVPEANRGSSPEALAKWAELLLRRHAIVTREATLTEPVPGGFSVLAVVLRALEERSRVRRGYFVAGLSGQQFAAPTAGDRLRRSSVDENVTILAASDPANPYGGVLPWPESSARPQRATGCKVLLSQGKLIAYANKDWSQLTTFFATESARAEAARVAAALSARGSRSRSRTLLIETIDGQPARATTLGEALLARGHQPAARGAVRASFDATPASERSSRVEESDEP